MNVRFEKMSGLIAAPFTPMDNFGEIDLLVISAYYALLKGNGVSGAFICGSTGEGPSLSITEKKTLILEWVRCAKDDPDFKIIVLVGGNNIKDCESLAEWCEVSGVDAISFTSPSYFKPGTLTQLVACCETVAMKAPNLPFYYYHIPALTGVHFLMRDLLLAAGSTIRNFAGIKYTHEDFMDYLTCVHFESGRYDILWGRDESFLAALSCGATGAVGSTFNYASPLYNLIIEAFNDGNFPEARKLQQKSIDMIQLLGNYGGLGTGKAFMRTVDLDCGHFRLPVNNLSKEQEVAFRKDLDSIGFYQYCSRRQGADKI
jgi:N-acetylneuraminate lyase